MCACVRVFSETKTKTDRATERQRQRQRPLTCGIVQPVARNSVRSHVVRYCERFDWIRCGGNLYCGDDRVRIVSCFQRTGAKQ